MNKRYTLGLDLGVASVGWAMLELNADGKPWRIMRSGVHLFEAGVEGNIEQGKDESKAKPRRDARQIRRQIWRRARRKRKLLSALQRHGLMPDGNIYTPENIDVFLKSLDKDLRKKWEGEGVSHREKQLLPYRLRAEAIHRRLEPFEVGRALYHLAQRRGFLSNRKSDKPDEETGKVKSGIAELKRLMDEAGCQTLGEYFASLDPEELRIRGRWTGRDMYEHEFNLIWEEQAKHHNLSDEARKQIHQAVFYQRPLKSQKGLVGKCELTGKRKAPVASRIAQEFRLLQKLNDLTIIYPDNTEEKLTDEQRERVLIELVYNENIKFSHLRKKQVLGLPRGSTFNLERGGEKQLPGHKTDTRLRELFGERYDEFSDAEKDQIVEDLLSFVKPSALARRGRRKWGLDSEQAKLFGDLQLEQGYASHSKQAMEALVPLLREGISYSTARKKLFPESFEANQAVDFLPPVHDAFTDDIRNPAVERALTELRKLTNAIIRRYGKPEYVHIELARDLKKGRKQRERISKDNRERQKNRDKAKARILEELGYQNPSRTDIEKVLLADECQWICPFTGKEISFSTLLGRNPQFDIEHIWPFSRTLDNSFLNKTLCYHEENRKRKRGYTPYQAYSKNQEEYDAILQRVSKFKSDIAFIKLQRFKAKEIPDDKRPERHLNDTRYISRKAQEYMGLLYGGAIDSNGKRRIIPCTGGLTAWLRREWQLHQVLSDTDEKNRSDHRHHAVDAIVIAAASQSQIQQLARSAEQAEELGSHRLFSGIEKPWETFIDDVRSSIDSIKVSHRQSRKVSGALHAESLYSKPYPGPKGVPQHRIRKELHKLSCKEISGDQIVDPHIRRVVQEKWQELGKGDPAKVFADPNNHPSIRTHDGRVIPVHKVRIIARANPRKIAEGARTRYVASGKGSNHHTIIAAKLDKDGNEKGWVDIPVSLAEAYERRDNKLPIVNQDLGPDLRFKFSLAANEYVELDDNSDQGRGIYRILSISDSDIEASSNTDGRTFKERRIAKERIRLRGSSLCKRNARKVHITYLGEVHNAGG